LTLGSIIKGALFIFVAIRGQRLPGGSCRGLNRDASDPQPLFDNEFERHHLKIGNTRSQRIPTRQIPTR